MINSVPIFHGTPLCFAGKSLPLHARYIQYVCLCEDFLKRLALVHVCTGLPRGGHDGRRHRQGCRRDEVEAHGVHAAEECDEAVDCTPVFEVTEEGNGTTIDGTKLGPDGVDVEESLQNESEDLSVMPYYRIVYIPV